MVVHLNNYRHIQNAEIFLTVHYNACVGADPGLLSLANAISIFEGINPALREFEDSKNMVAHYNKCFF
jgi:hypothetical protein